MIAHKHIGLALLGCSFVLFLLWALPYMSGVDGFQLAASASQEVVLAPEHSRLESQIKTLHVQYASKDGGVEQLERDILDTVDHVFADENPKGELLRGDAAYLTAVYVAAKGKPCSEDAQILKLCAKPAGGATSIPDLESLRLHGGVSSEGIFPDVGRSDWYALYVLFLTSSGIVDLHLDADGTGNFAGNTPVKAVDMERWLGRVTTGQDPVKPGMAPHVTLTKEQGVKMLKTVLEQEFLLRAARRM